MGRAADHRLQVRLFGALADNYCYLIHDPDTGLTGVIDTPDVAAIEAALSETGWSLDYILNTHHHWDHAGGNLELKQKTGCKVVGPQAEAARIPGIDIALSDGDTFELGSKTATVMTRPGIRADISSITSRQTILPLPATRCSRWVAVDYSRAQRRKCGLHCRNYWPGPTTRWFIVPTSTHRPTRRLP